MAMALIRIEDVFVAYGAPSRAVLAGIDLDIEEGSFVCLLGQTGCGKSTLLRLVLGSEHPLRGRILIDGSEHPQPDRSRGYVPQGVKEEMRRNLLAKLQTGEPLFPGCINRVSSIAHFERPANTFIQKLVETLAADDFDHPSKNIRGKPVFELNSGLPFQWHPREDVYKVLKRFAMLLIHGTI